MEISSVDCEKPRILHGPTWKMCSANLDSPVFPLSVNGSCIASGSTLRDKESIHDLLKSGPAETQNESVWCIPRRFGGGLILSSSNKWAVEGATSKSEARNGTIRDAVETPKMFFFCDDSNVWSLNELGMLTHVTKRHTTIFCLASLRDDLLVCEEAGLFISDGFKFTQMSLDFTNEVEVEVEVHAAVNLGEEIALLLVSREEMPQTWIALAKRVDLSLQVVSYATNELFLSDRGDMSRGFLKYIAELSLLLVGHSKCDQVAILRKEIDTWNVLLMPEGKQLGCTMASDGSTSFLRGIYAVDCRSVTSDYPYCIALGQSDGSLSVHWLDLPELWIESSVMIDSNTEPVSGHPAEQTVGSSKLISPSISAGLVGQAVGQPRGSSTLGSLGGAKVTASSITDGLFGQNACPATGSSQFGTFGGTEATSFNSAGLSSQAVSQATSSAPFGAFTATKATSSSSAGLFGQAAVPATGSSPFGAFGGTEATSSLSSAAHSGQTAGQPTGLTPFGAFGGATVTASSISGGLFCQAAGQATGSSPFAAFGGTKATSSSSAGLFGQAAAQATGSSPFGAFGGTNATSSSSAGLFGQAAAQATGASPFAAFGGTTVKASSSSIATPSSSAGLFGQAAAQATGSSPFGAFGGTKATSSSSAGLFGQAAAQATGSSRLGAFGEARESEASRSAGVMKKSSSGEFRETASVPLGLSDSSPSVHNKNRLVNEISQLEKSLGSLAPSTLKQMDAPNVVSSHGVCVESNLSVKNGSHYEEFSPIDGSLTQQTNPCRDSVESILTSWRKANAGSRVGGDDELLSLLFLVEETLCDSENDLPQVHSFVNLDYTRISGDQMMQTPALDSAVSEVDSSLKALFFADSPSEEVSLVRGRVTALNDKLDSVFERARRRVKPQAHAPPATERPLVVAPLSAPSVSTQNTRRQSFLRSSQPCGRALAEVLHEETDQTTTKNFSCGDSAWNMVRSIESHGRLLDKLDRDVRSLRMHLTQLKNANRR